MKTTETWLCTYTEQVNPGRKKKEIHADLAHWNPHWNHGWEADHKLWDMLRHECITCFKLRRDRCESAAASLEPHAAAESVKLQVQSSDWATRAGLVWGFHWPSRQISHEGCFPGIFQRNGERGRGVCYLVFMDVFLAPESWLLFLPISHFFFFFYCRNWHMNAAETKRMSSSNFQVIMNDFTSAPSWIQGLLSTLSSCPMTLNVT